MGNSKDVILGLDPWAPQVKTGGPLGANGDAADPNTPYWLIGNTPGPLGHQDHADPNQAMCRARLNAAPTVSGLRQPSTRPDANVLESYFAAMRSPEETWVGQQKLSPDELQTLVHEAELRLELFARDEAALVQVIDKVRKDIDVYGLVQTWYVGEADRREVLLAEIHSKFNDLRWGGKGVKVGGISETVEGNVVIDEDFRNANPAVIILGYELHEQVHYKHMSEMNRTVAGFRSLVNPLKYGKLLAQNWVAARKIESELAAHREQLNFYQTCLAGLPSEKARTERLLKALRARQPTVKP